MATSNETQVVVTVLQHDMENNPDVLAMVAASAALTISGVPFMGPIGAARVGYVDGEYVLNLAVDRRADRKLDLVMAGTAGRRADGRVGSPGAVRRNHARRRDVRPRRVASKVIEAIIKLAELAAKEPRDFTAPDYSALEADVLAVAEADLRAAYKITDKAAALRRGRRRQGQGQGALRRRRSKPAPSRPKRLGEVVHNLQAKIVRWNILDTKTAHRRP